MKDLRVVIVDDSAFSIAYIRNILESNGINVVGDAGSLEDVKAVVKEKKPTLVTMDMTLPDTDGLECTRAIHEIDNSVKVIVISSMMDDEIVKQAKRDKVSAYLQKPIDADELLSTIQRLTAVDEMYDFLIQEHLSVFKESFLDGMNRMTKTLLSYKEEFSSNKAHNSLGMTVIIGISGKFSGRLLLDLSKETARKFAASLYRREPKDDSEVLGVLGEFGNIIAGNACSMLNRKNKALGLRLAPPSILTGENVLISASTFKTNTAVAETEFGEMLLNIGFKKGEDEWMLS